MNNSEKFEQIFGFKPVYRVPDFIDTVPRRQPAPDRKLVVDIIKSGCNVVQTGKEKE